MTAATPSAVAARLSIPDRGLFKEGMYADVVVNGTEVVRDGEPTGAKPGRVVPGPGWRR